MENVIPSMNHYLWNGYREDLDDTSTKPYHRKNNVTQTTPPKFL